MIEATVIKLAWITLGVVLTCFSAGFYMLAGAVCVSLTPSLQDRLKTPEAYFPLVLGVLCLIWGLGLVVYGFTALLS